MNIIFPDVGLLYLLQSVIGSGLWYDLYTNNYTPGLASTLPDFTRANWSGYNPQFAPASSWTVQQLQAHVACIQGLPLVFFNPSMNPVTVYGYYVKDSTNTVLVAAGRFDLAPVQIAVGAGETVNPILGSYSGLDA